MVGAEDTGWQTLLYVSTNNSCSLTEVHHQDRGSYAHCKPPSKNRTAVSCGHCSHYRARFRADPAYHLLQGILEDASGAVLPDGTYGLSFRLYDAVAANNAIWTESHQAQVVGGVFTVLLGSKEALDPDFSDGYFIGITRDGETEMQPRLPLTSAPYALNAERAIVADTARFIEGEL